MKMVLPVFGTASQYARTQRPGFGMAVSSDVVGQIRPERINGATREVVQEFKNQSLRPIVQILGTDWQNNAAGVNAVTDLVDKLAADWQAAQKRDISSQVWKTGPITDELTVYAFNLMRFLRGKVRDDRQYRHLLSEVSNHIFIGAKDLPDAFVMPILQEAGWLKPVFRRRFGP